MNVFKNPLKLIVAGMFIVAMGFGMSTNLSTSENVNLHTLNMAIKTANAQGEHSCHYNDKKNRTFARGCKYSPGSLCELC